MHYWHMLPQGVGRAWCMKQKVASWWNTVTKFSTWNCKYNSNNARYYKHSKWIINKIISTLMMILYIFDFILWLKLCVYVYVNGHRSVGYVQIRRCWSSNLGHWTLRNLGSVIYCYTFILDPPCPIFLPYSVFTGGVTPSCPGTPPPHHP